MEGQKRYGLVSPILVRTLGKLADTSLMVEPRAKRGESVRERSPVVNLHDKELVEYTCCDGVAHRSEIRGLQMILRYERLQRFPAVFKSMTGL